MSPISASFYDNPSYSLLVTGVTGTEGKSTTVYLIWQLLTLLGKKTGFFSTVQQCFGDEVIFNSEHQTTPEAPVVQRFLRQMLDNGCEYAVVEASSHGLSPKTNRLGDVNFCSAVFTNITHEHMEFHETFDQYREDKANLFRALDKYVPATGEGKLNLNNPFGVINCDDRNARFFAKTTQQKTFMFSAAGRDGDVIIEAIESSSQGNWYVMHLPALNKRIELRDKLPGAFNSGNVLAALLTVSNLLYLPIYEITPFVKKLKPVHGRMTTINSGQNFEVIVDYAHTPSSFQAVFPPLRARIDKTGGKIISVFGSAGERDTQKRPEQGKIAAEYSDIVILTDEDPRGEDSMSILENIAAGVTAVGVTTVGVTTIGVTSDELQEQKIFTRGENLFLIPDRAAAIRKAISLANAGDIVIFLGKGHENSIIYKDKVMPFNEIAEVEKALQEAR
ncbi:MAG: UDP-N-acetylmuramyl-tripeptide synthetase, partial [Treponema sp.]|jgi:UDP-N-acetylmuramoyl-L-alanyl-D-glutamate--2,6-diaminopimelate ligase|nr:UDP-N-acetylmuramyl-tripeptide synthetase [Treponema sp.]